MTSVVTYNVFTELHDVPYRMNTISDILQKSDIDIICLQEMAFAHPKKIIKNKLQDKYFIFESNHYYRKYNYKAYLFSLIFLALFLYWHLNNNNSAFIYVFVILGIICIPHVFDFLFLSGLKGIYYMLYEINQDRTIDSCGLTILIKKDNFKKIKILKHAPFKNQGYVPQLNMARYYFNMIIPRPSFMIMLIESKNNTKFLLCNCHLVLGVDNDNRIYQIHELLNNLHKLKKEYLVNDIVICGDFNVNNESSDIKILESYGFFNTGKFKTWNPSKNEYCDDNLIDEQNDYIFINFNKQFKSTRIFDGEIYEILSDHYGIMTTIL
jgi:endonuclease/exonuclease/phosphatase family metal-dependent hydrolase